ncbi:MAG: hypothetical protein CVT74_18055, partial [Alphaproteobacteria bacterium HGW-Alphaproteobacteria-13]
ATSDAAFRGGACPTPEYTIAYTGNYTTSADANLLKRRPFAITHFPNGSYRNLSLNEFEQILATFGDLLHGQRPQHGSRCMSKMGGFTQRTSCRSESGAA